MERVQATLEISERRAGRVLGQPRSTQRYEGVPDEYEERLAVRMKALGSCIHAGPVAHWSAAAGRRLAGQPHARATALA